MAIPVGPGVQAEITKVQGTPIESAGEVYQPSDFERSHTEIEIGASDGIHKAFRIVVYDKERNVTFTCAPVDGPDGGDFFLASSAPTPPSPSGFGYGFDVAYPAGQNLQAVAQTLGAKWALIYIGGPNYVGDWPLAIAQALQPSLEWGYLLCYVGANYIDGALRAGPLSPDNGYGHGWDAGRQMQAYGFTKGTVFLDVEYDTFATDPAGTKIYATAWVQGLYDFAAQPGVGLVVQAGGYGSPAFLSAMQQQVNPYATYVAIWDGQPFTEGYDVHQYRGSTTVDGVGVDLDIAQATDNLEFSRL